MLCVRHVLKQGCRSVVYICVVGRGMFVDTRSVSTQACSKLVACHPNIDLLAISTWDAVNNIVLLLWIYGILYWPEDVFGGQKGSESDFHRRIVFF